MGLVGKRFRVAECCIPFEFMQPLGFEFAVAADLDLGCPSASSQLLQHPAQAVATVCILGVGRLLLPAFPIPGSWRECVLGTSTVAAGSRQLQPENTASVWFYHAYDDEEQEHAASAWFHLP